MRGNVIRSRVEGRLVPHFRFSVPVELRQRVPVQAEQHLKTKRFRVTILDTKSTQSYQVQTYTVGNLWKSYCIVYFMYFYTNNNKRLRFKQVCAYNTLRISVISSRKLMKEFVYRSRVSYEHLTYRIDVSIYV